MRAVQSLPVLGTRVNVRLFVTGVLIAILSVVAAGWLLQHGDIVTAVSLGLFVLVGALYVGISRAEAAATSSK